MQNAELGLPWMSDAAIPGLVVKVVEPDAGANPAHRTYVYLHGAGANEDDLLGLSHYIDPNARHIALRAPISYGDGWCWYPLSWDGTRIQVDQKRLDRSATGTKRVLAVARRFTSGTRPIRK